MSELLTLAIITSFKILFVWAAMQEGNILHWLCKGINWPLSFLPPGIYLWIRKPLTECLFCMSSVWGIIFTIKLSSFTFEYLEFLMIVAGINYIIQWLVIPDAE